MLMHALSEAIAEARGSALDAPKTLRGATCGLNTITRTLQEDITAAKSDRAAPRVLFVCYGDAEPQSLVGHLPMLVCTYNAMLVPKVADADSLSAKLPTKPSTRPALLLVPLPSGAELLLSTAAGLRRLSAVLVDSEFPGIDTLVSRVVPIVGADGPRAHWLERGGRVALEATRIKHVSTSAPSNMGAARAQKKASRAAHRRKSISS